MLKLALVVLAGISILSAQTPVLTAFGNAAIPSLEQHVPAHLLPRSLATIFGQNLSPVTLATLPPWKSELGGVELRLRVLGPACQTTGEPCELTAPLLFVSPTQINFMVPDVSPSVYDLDLMTLDIVFVLNGVEFDSYFSFYSDPNGDSAVFQAGYDCDFSLSETQPQACGYSSVAGQYRVPLAAATDAKGDLISSANPLRQTETLTLWTTGMPNLVQNGTFLDQLVPQPITFGVTGGTNSTSDAAWQTLTPQWAGESPQFMGLDQINLRLPTCTGAAATVEQRYDLTLQFAAVNADPNLDIGFAMLFIPFLINPGDPSCQF
jgi:hypothetical protein